MFSTKPPKRKLFAGGSTATKEASVCRAEQFSVQVAARDMDGVLSFLFTHLYRSKCLLRMYFDLSSENQKGVLKGSPTRLSDVQPFDGL